MASAAKEATGPAAQLRAAQVRCKNSCMHSTCICGGYAAGVLAAKLLPLHAAWGWMPWDVVLAEGRERLNAPA